MEFDYLWENGPLVAKTEGFRLSTDSVLLGNFANINGLKCGIDLGCASGIISVLLLARSTKLHMTGIELNKTEADNARLNMIQNGFEERSKIICGDIRNYKELKSGYYDLVISNPPYFAVGSGPVSPDADRARQRGEENCTLEDIISASEYLCKFGGRVVLVHKPERLSELMCAMTRHQIEPKRLRCVAKNVNSPASLVLIEGRRGGSPGLKIESTLYLQNEDGSDSQEIKTIYHR